MRPVAGVRRRIGRLGLVVALAVLSLPGAAMASTAQSQGGLLSVTAAPGETNSIGVFYGPPGDVQPGWTVTDQAGLVAGPGCTPVAGAESTSATCDAPTQVSISAGDRDDTVSGTTRCFPTPGSTTLGCPPLPVPITIEAGSGNDTSYARGRPTDVHGGDGDDQVNSGVSVPNSSAPDSNESADVVNGDAGSDSISTGGGDDSVDGGPGNDVVMSGAGTDTVDGGDGKDVLYFEAGDDSLRGGPGDDSFLVGGTLAVARKDADVALGGAGDDTFSANDGPTGRQEWHGGDGADRMLVGTSPTSATAPDGAYDLSGDSGKDLISGSGGADRIDGGADDDVLLGREGADAIDGGTGDDSMIGEYGDPRQEVAPPGNDVMTGGAGNDTMWGDGGSDRITAGDGDDALNGDTGDDTLDAGAGSDKLAGAGGNDTLNGGDHGDRLSGDAGDDTLGGDAGNDVERGGLGADTLSGGSGDDFVSGDDDPDTQSGGGGVDVLRTRDDEQNIVRCEGRDDLALTTRDDRVTGCAFVDRGVRQRPVLGRSVVVKPDPDEPQELRLRRAAVFVPFEDKAVLPVRSAVDPGSGRVSISSSLGRASTQQATLVGDAVAVGQSGGRTPVTNLALTGGDFNACAAPTTDSVRSVDVKARGRTSAIGRNSSAMTQSATLTVEDRCDATVTTVTRGSVTVRDFAKKRSVKVRAGHRYFARRGNR